MSRPGGAYNRVFNFGSPRPKKEVFKVFCHKILIMVPRVGDGDPSFPVHPFEILEAFTSPPSHSSPPLEKLFCIMFSKHNTRTHRNYDNSLPEYIHRGIHVQWVSSKLVKKHCSKFKYQPCTYILPPTKKNTKV